MVNRTGNFYQASESSTGTHLALRWRGRVRYVVPRSMQGQRACWKVFRPGRLGLPLRAMACLPRFSGLASCREGASLAVIRKALGGETGLSCSRIGTPGPWSKDTILFLSKKNAKPVYIVKAGAGEAVDSLLRNEAKWLRSLRDEASLADHIPQLIAHHAGTDFCFVAERPLPGAIDYQLREAQIAFLRKLQKCTCRAKRFEESKLYGNLCSRREKLRGLLSVEWRTRLDKGMLRIEQSIAGKTVLMVAAHEDFTPWNIRVDGGIARVFDWEYAEEEQFPLFDPLHFVLMPLSLRRKPVAGMIENMEKAVQSCRQWLGEESCRNTNAQVLAYLMNLCTLYLWSEHGKSDSDCVLASYAVLIDRLSL